MEVFLLNVNQLPYLLMYEYNWNLEKKLVKPGKGKLKLME
jgi:hypothetical protein